MDEFDLITKLESETATIEEIESNLPIRFHTKSKLTSTVKPDDLRVDMTYQRSVSDSRVSSICRNFNQQALGIVTLSIRENGELFIIDGQHRVEALKKMGKGNIQINAIVLFDLTVQDEANLFLIMNDNRTKPKRFDLHKAAYAIDSYYAAWLHTYYEKEWLATILQSENGNPKGIAKAISVCNRCDVQALCLMTAVNNEEEYGIWGGFTSKERKKIFNGINMTIDEAEEAVQWKRNL